MQTKREILYHSPTGETYKLFEDMLSKPHILVAGETGCGKSVAINGLIATILYRLPLDQEEGAQMILIDPKSVELSDYSELPHTIAYADGFNPSAWLSAMQKAVSIMESRKAYMKQNREKMYSGGDLYVIIDEWATVFKNGGKEAYKLMMRLTCEGRAERVHVIMATQHPKSTIIPTEIRGNFDARLCLRTVDAGASRVILGQAGCEQFPFPKDVGYASGYYYHGGIVDYYKKLPYVQQDELDSLLDWWATSGQTEISTKTQKQKKQPLIDRLFNMLNIETYPVG